MASSRCQSGEETHVGDEQTGDKGPGGAGSEVPFAYRPSGAKGQMAVLAVFGALGVLAGYVAAAICAGAALLLNIIHNLLPWYFFIAPIIILALMALPPAVYGFAVAAVVGRGCRQAKHRHPESAGGVAFVSALIGLAVFIGLGLRPLPNGQQFFSDILMPFVRLMLGGCITFNWLEPPQPVNVPEWVVYGVLGLSALLGLAVAYGQADEKVRTTPFCEQCQDYLNKTTLWEIAAQSGQNAIRAFEALDGPAICELTPGHGLEHRIGVELWMCPCEGSVFLDLMEKRKQDNPVRLFSRSLSREEAKRLCSCVPAV